jgi:hypothetical protein
MLLQAALLIGTLLGPACAADPGTAQTGEIRGAWHWAGSRGGIAGVHVGPESEGYSVMLYFRRDGTLDIYRDGEHQTRVLVATTHPTDTAELGQYVLQYADPLTVLPFGIGVDRHSVHTSGRDTLILIDPCCDRFEHVFVR